MVSLANRDLKRTAFRQALIENASSRFRNNRSIAHHRALLESLEPRHLMAAVPIANNDAAFYTNLSTDLVVSTSSTPAHLLANDLDIDGGSITTSLVTNPAAGTLIAFGTNGTFTYRPNTGFAGIDSFTYKINDGSLDSNVAKVTIAIGTKLLARQNLDSNIVDNLPSPFGLVVPHKSTKLLAFHAGDCAGCRWTFGASMRMMDAENPRRCCGSSEISPARRCSLWLVHALRMSSLVANSVISG